MKCFGDGRFGQLGAGHTNVNGDDDVEMGDNLMPLDFCGDFIPIQLTVGAHHSCVLSSNYTVKCWGRNQMGQLGLGDDENRGDNGHEMGCDLNEVDLGDDFIPIQVFVGSNHSCAVSTDGDLKCWGSNEFGECGVPIEDEDDDEVIGDDDDEMGDNLDTIDLGDDFTVNDVKCSNGFTCVSSTSGGVKCFGRNDEGQLGYESTDNIGDDEDEMGDNLPFLDLGTGFNASNTEFPSGSGGSHSVCISDVLDVKAWGRNNEGQLGNGDESGDSVGDDEDEMGDYLEVYESVCFLVTSCFEMLGDVSTLRLKNFESLSSCNILQHFGS